MQCTLFKLQQYKKFPVLCFVCFGLQVRKKLCYKSAGKARGSLLVGAIGIIKMTADSSRMKVACCGGHTVSSPLQLLSSDRLFADFSPSADTALAIPSHHLTINQSSPSVFATQGKLRLASSTINMYVR